MGSARAGYALAGLGVGAAGDLLVGLLAAAIQKRWFGDQFSSQSMWLLGGCILVGLLVGYGLGGPARSSAPDGGQSAATGDAETVRVTRLQSWLSYVKLRGRGISLNDTTSVGSRIDIDTRHDR
jgi:hypothetical protein